MPVVGVMVTASHNPKEDNGFKVYWSNGSQIIPPHDAGIATAIEENLEPWMTYDTTDEFVLSHANFNDATATVASAYFTSIRVLSTPPPSGLRPLRIAYTGSNVTACFTCKYLVDWFIHLCDSDAWCWLPMD